MPAHVDEIVLGCVGIRLRAKLIENTAVSMLTPNVGVGGTPTYEDCAAIWAVVYEWVSTDLYNLTSNIWTFFRLECFSREETEGPTADGTFTVLGNEVETVDHYSSAYAPLVLGNTNTQGYGQHSRMFNLAPILAHVTHTAYETDYMVDLKESWQRLNTALQDVEGATYALGVARRSRGNIVPIRSWAYSEKLTMQTRRRPGFGE